MNRILLLPLLVLIGLAGCKDTGKTNPELEIAKKYYKALDESSSSEMRSVLTDSLITAIPKYDYEVRYSRDDYVEKWLKWDSIFDPTYKILAMEMENGMVKAKVSKIDKRISLLMNEPFITNETLLFENGKLITVETEYVNFNEATWEKNKNALLSWIEKNHPELDGFIYDQTESGGRKYLKAIELYKSKK